MNQKEFEAVVKKAMRKYVQGQATQKDEAILWAAQALAKLKVK